MLCLAAATQQSQTEPSSKTRRGRTRETYLVFGMSVYVGGQRARLIEDVRLGEVWLLGITEEDETLGS
jgi:hypothetical protein